jgi:hypothetical protein
MRMIGAVMVLIGVYIGIRLGLDWRAFQPAPTLCGCEFDAALKFKAMLSSVAACCIAIFAVVAGISLARRYRRGLIVLATWFVVVAAVPWTDQVVPPSYPVATRAVALTVVSVTLALTCLLFYRIHRVPHVA